VDWSLRNFEIARITGTRPQNVFAIRKKLGAPGPKAWQKHDGRHRILSTWVAVDWSKQDIVIAEEMKVSRERVRKVRQILGAPKPKMARRRRQRLHPWQKMNFDLPGAILEQIWTLPKTNATKYRRLNRLHKPKWDLRRGIETLKREKQYGPYLAAVRAEERKAKSNRS